MNINEITAQNCGNVCSCCAEHEVVENTDFIGKGFEAPSDKNGHLI